MTSEKDYDRIMALTAEIDHRDRLIAELTIENGQLHLALMPIRCAGCGGSPATDPGWRWAYGEGYANGHIIPGSVPDLCGPVDFRSSPSSGACPLGETGGRTVKWNPIYWLCRFGTRKPPKPNANIVDIAAWRQSAGESYAEGRDAEAKSKREIADFLHSSRGLQQAELDEVRKQLAAAQRALDTFTASQREALEASQSSLGKGDTE